MSDRMTFKIVAISSGDRILENKHRFLINHQTRAIAMTIEKLRFTSLMHAIRSEIDRTNLVGLL
ncbi:MAG: hypothetical protein HC820_02850, partial [Hydrococcus sp. RM1_1_31]|nr:hypothetical protein [Hydrococcus sp. RM1_1_31]